MYQEHYWSDLSDNQREINRLHNGLLPLPRCIICRCMLLNSAEHCLDFLRQASMCHADIGLITFQWSPDSPIPVANATTHQCAKWDKIDKWTKERTVDMMKPGWLVHPTKGNILIFSVICKRFMCTTEENPCCKYTCTDCVGNLRTCLPLR